jgi:hypothetical protein
MEFSTKAVEKMAEIMVGEMEKTGQRAEGIREVEMGMREIMRKVGEKALGPYLERMDQTEPFEKGMSCECGGQQENQICRGAVILSVFGRVRYKRRYYTCAHCASGQVPQDRRLGLSAGEVTAGLAELLALAGVEVALEEASRLVERCLLIQVSDNTLCKETERFGELQKTQEAHWIEQSKSEAWLQGRLQTGRSDIWLHRWCHGSL